MKKLKKTKKHKKFKIGDRVEVLRRGTNHISITNGSKGQVVWISSITGFINVLFDNGVDGYFCSDDLKKIKPTPEPYKDSLIRHEKESLLEQPLNWSIASEKPPEQDKPIYISSSSGVHITEITAPSINWRKGVGIILMLPAFGWVLTLMLSLFQSNPYIATTVLTIASFLVGAWIYNDYN
jgi:hypothetical protein